MDDQANIAADEPNSLAQIASAGARLREARERAGLKVADVASHLKFAPRQVEALEAGDLSQLPEMPFVRGFVRSYAKLLQIDSTPLLAALPDAPARMVTTPMVSMSKEVPFPGIYAARKNNIVWLAAGLGVAVTLGLFVWFSSSSQPSPKSKIVNVTLPPVVSTSPVAVNTPVLSTDVGKAILPAAEKPEPLKSAPANPVPANPVPENPVPAKTPTAAPVIKVEPRPPVISGVSIPTTNTLATNIAKPNVSASTTPTAQTSIKPASDVAAPPKRPAAIHLVFDEDAWVEIMDKDGTVVMAQLNLAGSKRRVFSDNPPYTAVIGNAEKVQLTYKGKPIDLAPFNRAGVARLTLE